MASRKGRERILIIVILFLLLPIVDVFLLDPYVLHDVIPAETIFGFITVIVEIILIFIYWRYFRSGKKLPEGKPETDMRPPR